MNASKTFHSAATLLALGSAFFCLAIVFTYPLVLAPQEANRFNSPDAILNAWILNWDVGQLVSGNFDVFDAPLFYPEPNVLALSENLLTAAVLVLPIRLMTDDPILVSNAALLLVLVANGLSGYFLAYAYTRDSTAGITTGLLVGFGSFHWAHIPHLQLQIVFPMVLSFLFARRFRNDPRPSTGIALALSVAATFGASGYYAAFLVTALPLFVLSDLFGIESRRRLRVIARFGVAGGLAGLFSLPLLLPYGQQMGAGYRRALSAAANHSAEPIAYATSAARVHFMLPSEPQEPFFPGFAALGLTVLALWSARSTPEEKRKRDLLPWLLVGALGVAISLGPSSVLFRLLYELGPYQAIRVPSRAGVLFLLAVAVLAGVGISRVRSARYRYLLVGLLALECFSGPLPWIMERPAIPRIYASVQKLERPGALAELPMPPPERFQDNARYVYRSMFHGRPLVNGYSGFVPRSYRETQSLLMSERFDDGLAQLSADGVRFLIVHEGRVGPRLTRQVELAEDSGHLELIERLDADALYRVAGPSR